MVLVVALGLAIVLAIEVYIVTAYSGGNVRLVGTMANRRHAIYLGDSAFGDILARLRQSTWDARWFRAGPDVQVGSPLLGGRVDSYVADASDEPHAVEVWIRASLEQSVVAMYWRVRFRDEGLDVRNLVSPVFFTFLSPDLPPPVGGAADPTLARAAAVRAEQRANAPAAIALARQVSHAADFATVASILGLTPGGIVPDARPGQPAGSQASYLRQVASVARPPVPSPPAAPQPSTLATQFPTPLDLPGVIAAVFAGQGLPPAATPTAAHFADPALAARAYAAAVSRAPTSVRDPRWETCVEDCKAYITELAKMSSGSGCTTCHAALDALIAYLAEVTALEAARRGRALPAPADVTAYPYDDSGYTNALTHYREWWSQ